MFMCLGAYLKRMDPGRAAARYSSDVTDWLSVARHTSRYRPSSLLGCRACVYTRGIHKLVTNARFILTACTTLQISS